MLQTKNDTPVLVVIDTETAIAPVSFPQYPIALPPIPPFVALARMVKRPIRECTVLPYQTVGRFVWCQFTPWESADPLLPVPVVDFGNGFFEAITPIVYHLLDWSRHNDQRHWAEHTHSCLKDFAAYLSNNAFSIGMTQAEADWLILQLWMYYADPSLAWLEPVRVVSVQDRFYRRFRARQPM